MASSLRSASDLSRDLAETLEKCLQLLSAGVWAQQVTNTSNLPRLLAEALTTAKRQHAKLERMLGVQSASTTERVE